MPSMRHGIWMAIGQKVSFFSNDDVAGLTDHEIEQMVRASGLI